MLKNKNFILISLVNFAAMIVYFLLFVVSGPYAQEKFGASTSMAGLAAGSMVLGCLVGRFSSAKLVSLIGLTRFLLAGIAIFIVSIAFYFLAYDLTTLLIVRFVSGIGIGCIGTVAGTIIAYIVPPSKLGTGIAWFSMSNVLGMAIGPFLGIALMQSAGYEVLFLICLGMAALCLVLALGLKIKIDLKPAKKQKSGFSIDDYIERNTIPVAFVVLVVCLGYASVQAFISFYAKEIDLVGPASMFFLVYAGIVLFSRPLSGKAFDLFGENVILYPALIIMAAGLAVFSQATEGWHMLLAGGLIGGGFGNFQSVLQALAIRTAPPRRYGQATSTFFIFLDLGIGLGPFLLGGLVGALGYRGFYEAMSLLILASMPLYYILYGNRRSRLFYRMRQRKRRTRS